MTVNIEADFFEKVRKHTEDSEIVYNNKLRDHFAGLAMTALIPVYWATESEFDSVKTMIKCNVEAAYEYADAMLKQRSLTND